MVITPTPKTTTPAAISGTSLHSSLSATAASAPSPSQIADKQLGSQPPTHEQIAARAYEKFVSSGGQSGRCSKNWSEAETELKQQAAAPGGLDKASTAASGEMASEGAGGAVGDSAHSGVVTRPLQPASPGGKFFEPSPMTRPAGR